MVCVKVVRRRTRCHTTTHHDSEQYDRYVSMFCVLQTIAHALIREEKAVEEAIINFVIAMCVVLCTMSDSTYVHVHVCGSARTGGGAHVK